MGLGVRLQSNGVQYNRILPGMTAEMPDGNYMEVYIADVHEEDKKYAFTRVSADQGVTWTDPVRVMGCPMNEELANPGIKVVRDGPHSGRAIVTVRHHKDKGGNTDHPDDWNYYSLISSVSTDRGRHWSSPAVIRKEVDDKDRSLWEPYIEEHSNGTLQVFYTAARAEHTPHNTPEYKGLIESKFSYDGGLTWLDPFTVIGGSTDGKWTIGMFVTARSLTTGELIGVYETRDPAGPNGKEYKMHIRTIRGSVDGRHWSSKSKLLYSEDVGSGQKEVPYSGAPWVVSTSKNIFIAVFQTSPYKKDDQIPKEYIGTLKGLVCKYVSSTDNGHTWTNEPREFLSPEHAIWPNMTLKRNGHIISQSTKMAQTQYYSAPITIKTHKGQFITANNYDIVAIYPDAAKYEVLNLIFLENGRFALQTADGNYLSAHNGGGGYIHTRNTYIDTWESFEGVWIEDLDNGTSRWALKTWSNHYLTAVNGGGSYISAHATEIGPHEIFTYNPHETIIERQHYHEMDLRP